MINDANKFVFHKQETSIRQNEREKNLLIEELTAQNARLTQQLQAATQTETQLQTKLQDIKVLRSAAVFCLIESELWTHSNYLFSGPIFNTTQ